MPNSFTSYTRSHSGYPTQPLLERSSGSLSQVRYYVRFVRHEVADARLYPRKGVLIERATPNCVAGPVRLVNCCKVDTLLTGAGCARARGKRGHSVCIMARHGLKLLVSVLCTAHGQILKPDGFSDPARPWLVASKAMCGPCCDGQSYCGSLDKDYVVPSHGAGGLPGGSVVPAGTNMTCHKKDWSFDLAAGAGGRCLPQLSAGIPRPVTFCQDLLPDHTAGAVLTPVIYHSGKPRASTARIFSPCFSSLPVAKRLP